MKVIFINIVNKFLTTSLFFPTHINFPMILYLFDLQDVKNYKQPKPLVKQGNVKNRKTKKLQILFLKIRKYVLQEKYQLK